MYKAMYEVSEILAFYASRVKTLEHTTLYHRAPATDIFLFKGDKDLGKNF